MNRRSILGLVVSIIMVVSMWYGFRFEVEPEMPNQTQPKHNGGKYKYLTILNLYLQFIYFNLTIVNYFFGSDQTIVSRMTKLQKLRDLIFSSIAFPLANFVCLTFWLIYHYDRELIFPEQLDRFLPATLNHVMHTLPIVGIHLDNILNHHVYSSRKKNLSLLLFLSIVYICWIHYLNYINWYQYGVNIWVYPILEVLPVFYRCLFFLSLILFNVFLYFFGELVTNVIHQNSLIHKRNQSKTQ